MSESKRGAGRYYTAGNPFSCPPFAAWAERAGLREAEVLEPFAGRGSLVERLKELNLCSRWRGFDILPAAEKVERRDTLADFPRGFDVCVTNPPWLAKNSATARGLPFPVCEFDDAYKFALDKCLTNCAWVAALVPESFIRAGLFEGRLEVFVSLTGAMFLDTAHPVGLALFAPCVSADVEVWSGMRRVGLLSELRGFVPAVSARRRRAVRFNSPSGNLGLIALDNTRGPSIRFCEPEELDGYEVGVSSRAVTKMDVPFDFCIDGCNGFLNSFRENTGDVLMTSFRGLRKDGMYRRRLDWGLARTIVARSF